MGEEIMLQRKWNCASDFIIRVSRSDEGFFQGKIEHVQSGQVHRLKDFMEMLLLIQGKLDRLGYPQAETELRCWSD